MSRGLVEFDDGGVSLPIDLMTFSGGTLNLYASGEVNLEEVTVGLVNFSIYGEDDILIAVGKFDTTNSFRQAREEGADYMQLTLNLELGEAVFNR